MTSAKVLTDEDLANFFIEGKNEFLIIASPTCHRCHKLVKEAETVDRVISLYVLQHPNSLGGHILSQLEVASAPSVIFSSQKGISILTGEGSFDAIFKWMDEQIK